MVKLLLIITAFLILMYLVFVVRNACLVYQKMYRKHKDIKNKWLRHFVCALYALGYAFAASAVPEFDYDE